MPIREQPWDDGSSIDDVPSTRGAPQLGPISFRRVVRRDFALLADWLAQPHVARWWNHESTADAVERDFGPTVDGVEPSQDHLALFAGAPFGLVQYSHFDAYPEYTEELQELLAVPVGAVTIDYLIGDPQRIGLGWGTAMIVAFCERIWRTDPVATCVIVPVVSANHASWRALLRAGFRVVASGDLVPDNPIDDPLHKILRLDRRSASLPQ